MGGYDKRGCEVCDSKKRMCGMRFVWGISVVSVVRGRRVCDVSRQAARTKQCKYCHALNDHNTAAKASQKMKGKKSQRKQRNR